MRVAEIFRLALVAATLSIAAACSTHGEAPADAHADPTRALFQRNCAMCHGHEGEGQQVGTLSVPALREGKPATDPDERLFAQISNGGNGMPPFKYSLTDEQIQDLMRFVREEIQHRPAAPKR